MAVRHIADAARTSSCRKRQWHDVDGNLSFVVIFLRLCAVPLEQINTCQIIA